MKEKNFKNLIFAGLAAVLVFGPLARGAVRLWSITFIEWIVFSLVFLWFWQMNNHSGWKFQATRLDLPVWGFLGLSVVSCVSGIYPYPGILDIFRVLTCISIYYLVVNLFDWNLQLRFFRLIIFMGAALSLLGTGQCFFGLQHAWWSNSLAATYVNHAHFAGYLEMAMAINLGVLLGLNQDEVVSSLQLLFKRILFTGTLVLMVAAFVLAQSRGGWIAFILASLVLAALLAHRKMISRGKVSVFLTCVFLFIIFLGFGEDKIAYRMHTIEINEESKLMNGRFEVWKSSIPMIRDNFLNGTGIGTFVWAFPKYRPEGFNVRYNYAHNDYIHMTAEMGIFVLPLFIWGMFVVLQSGFAVNSQDLLLQRMTHLGCATGILSLIIHGFVDFNFHIPANMMVFVCLTGILLRKDRGRNRKKVWK